MQKTKAFPLVREDRETLRQWLRRSTTPSGQTRRARIPPSLDEGRSPTVTARLLHDNRANVHLWRRRYRAQRLAGLVACLQCGSSPVTDVAGLYLNPADSALVPIRTVRQDPEPSDGVGERSRAADVVGLCSPQLFVPSRAVRDERW